MYEFILKKGTSILQLFVEPELGQICQFQGCFTPMLLMNAFMNRKVLG
jgi:hypothetical protein